METKFLIIDGNSLACRAAFAHNPNFGPDLCNTAGKPTGGTYRFFNMFDRILSQVRPTHAVVGWDVGRETFRQKLDASYKANREKSTSDELKTFFMDIKYILTSIGVKNAGIPGYEGDDIVGTYATISKAKKNFIVSGDKDSFQLSNDNTFIIFPKNGFKEIEIITPQYILENYNIPVERFVDLKALMGDDGDNVKGIAGCGEKTAAKLINHYGNVEQIVLNAENIDIKGVNKTVKTNILEWVPRSELVKKLVTIKRDVEVPYDFNECKLKLEWENAREIFKELEFTSFIRKLNGGEFYNASKI